jgi:hypothetical protein
MVVVFVLMGIVLGLVGVVLMILVSFPVGLCLLLIGAAAIMFGVFAPVGYK